MSQVRAQVKASFIANATLSAYRIVALVSANTVGYATTTTSLMFGVTEDASEDGTGTAVSVIIGGTAKVQINESITSAGLITAGANGLGLPLTQPFLINSTTASGRGIGMALEGASTTNAVIEVLVQPMLNSIRHS
jgi:hypothetical protein